jgi:2-haloacid dehalogenase
VTLGVNAKFVSFDCYGTLIDFQIDHAMKEVFGVRLPEDKESDFYATCEATRLDEVLGEYKPYSQVIRNATRRGALRHGIEFRDVDADAIYETIPTWGPHPGVTQALNMLAELCPLVILSNAADDQIARNVEHLGAPFHAVITAQQARGYKPRMRPFEYMIEQLGCDPSEIVHVSSSPRYDLITARDVGIVHTVLLDRGFEPPQPWLGYQAIGELSELAALLNY